MYLRNKFVDGLALQAVVLILGHSSVGEEITKQPKINVFIPLEVFFWDCYLLWALSSEPVVF